jgi:hypothetical protein
MPLIAIFEVLKENKRKDKMTVLCILHLYLQALIKVCFKQIINSDIKVNCF